MAVLSILLVYYAKGFLRLHRETTTAVSRDRLANASLLRQCTPRLVESKFDASILNYSQYFLPRWERVTPLDFSFSDATRRPCAQGYEPYFVMLVMSMTPNRYLRDAVRSTWGSVNKTGSWPGRHLTEKVIVVFVLGKTGNDTSLFREALEEGDIIHVSVNEAYFNLTYKVMMGFKWVNEFCPLAHFVIKCDEDTFPNIPQIISMTKSLDMTDTILGPFYSTDEVFRKGKYAVSEAGYPAPKYPPHCKGNFYLIPAKLAFRLISVAERIPYVNMEAAHVTGILAAVVGGVKYRTFSKAQYDIHLPPEVCEYITGSKILAQKVFPPLTCQLWDRFENPELC